MKERNTNMSSGLGEAASERGFSLVEMSVVVMLILIISAIALIAYLPTLQDARFDAAMKEVVDQLRQAREYAITNRRYVQVTFPTPVVAGVTQYEVTMQVRNDLTAGAGAVDPILSTTPIESPAQFYVFAAAPDTPDAFGKGAAVVFEGLAGGPVGGMLFQSDGELVDGATFQPINGTVFIGQPGKNSTARAVTVLGGTGRVRGWKGTGALWARF
ncbi:MAG: prepilin-type N-terminal cleavage/methylation domain-containing protein [Candidatus Acidiferrales bacterium]